MINALRFKYRELYWAAAYAAQAQSVAQREQVGVIIVTPAGIMLPGWNGQPAGHKTNVCENGTAWTPTGRRPKTDRSVIHAENNALGKAMQAGVSLVGAHLYSTVSPCDVCARGVIPSGISRVFYDRLHDDTLGMDMLRDAGIMVISRHHQNILVNVMEYPKAWNDVTELQEVAQAIYENNSQYWPLTIHQARALARDNLAADESATIIDGVAEAMVKIKG